jgi:hypothetical protein
MTRAVEFKVVEFAVIHANGEAVRRFVADLKNLKDWDASTRDVRLVRAGDSTSGSPDVYDVSVDFAPFGGCCLCLPTSSATRLSYEVAQPVNRTPLVMKGAGSGVRTLETYTFRSVGPNTTELTYVVRVELTGWRTSFAACIERRTRDLARAALRRLGRLW